MTAPITNSNPAARPFAGKATFVWRLPVGCDEVGPDSAGAPTTLVWVTTTTPPFESVDVKVDVTVSDEVADVVVDDLKVVDEEVLDPVLLLANSHVSSRCCATTWPN